MRERVLEQFPHQVGGPTISSLNGRAQFCDTDFAAGKAAERRYIFASGASRWFPRVDLQSPEGAA
jgi:hypothetical protein